MSLTQAPKEVVWLRKLLGDLGYQQSVATPLCCENQSAIALSQNLKYHSSMKHIEVQDHYIQKNGSKRRSVLYCARENMEANIMTKSLPKLKHVKFTTNLGINLDDSLETKKNRQRLHRVSYL